MRFPEAMSHDFIARFFRYFCSGLLALAVHLSLLGFLVEVVGENAAAATCVGFVFASVCNYLFQQSWVFEAAGSHRVFFPRYVVITTATFCANLLLFQMLNAVIGIPYFIAQLLSTALIFVLNFVINQRYTFRSAPSPPQRPDCP